MQSYDAKFSIIASIVINSNKNKQLLADGRAQIISRFLLHFFQRKPSFSVTSLRETVRKLVFVSAWFSLLFIFLQEELQNLVYNL
jgi:hypothetical protein